MFFICVKDLPRRLLGYEATVGGSLPAARRPARLVLARPSLASLLGRKYGEAIDFYRLFIRAQRGRNPARKDNLTPAADLHNKNPSLALSGKNRI